MTKEDIVQTLRDGRKWYAMSNQPSSPITENHFHYYMLQWDSVMGHGIEAKHCTRENTTTQRNLDISIEDVAECLLESPYHLRDRHR